MLEKKQENIFYFKNLKKQEIPHQDNYLKSLDISMFDTSNLDNLCGAFEGCSSLTFLDLSNFSFAIVSNIKSMFKDCKTLKYLNLGNIQTSNVQRLFQTFKDCESLFQLPDISMWNKNSLKNISFFFSKSSSSTNTENIDIRDCQNYF